MSPLLLLLIALLTYASRAAGLVLLAPPSPRLRRYLDRVPAPLFASLAAIALVGDTGALAPAPVLGALLGAVAFSPSRSLPLILAGGIVGWALLSWPFPISG
jgi:branched-subunit amino acid transport protein